MSHVHVPYEHPPIFLGGNGSQHLSQGDVHCTDIVLRFQIPGKCWMVISNITPVRFLNPSNFLRIQSKTKVLATYAGKAKTLSKRSPRPLSRQRPCKTLVPHVNAALNKTSALLSPKMILCFYVSLQWNAGSKDSTCLARRSCYANFPIHFLTSIPPQALQKSN